VSDLIFSVAFGDDTMKKLCVPIPCNSPGFLYALDMVSFFFWP
jgi:hypothetical protein